MGNREAAIAELYRVEGRAEILNGEVVVMPAGGWRHGRVAGAIFVSLRAYEAHAGDGYALPDGVGFVVDLPHRWSFSPDAAFALQPPTNEFVNGAPVFAVEVRSPDDYGPAAEREMAAKRADYFATGSLVVWDVDFIREHMVRVFRANAPETPTVYHRGDRADAEPAVPGWSVPVNDLFTD
jgi:Uma2 family endonuclease